MLDNRTVGSRLKDCRKSQELTLKVIEARSGVSATHVSEIERGKTSPTIGALAKIADALGKDITYFVEPEVLEDVCHLDPETYGRESLPWGSGEIERLTRGVPGARLSAYRITLEKVGAPSPEHTHEGNEVFYVEQGRVQFRVDGQAYDLERGDSIQYQASRAHSYVNLGPGPAKLLFFSSRRRTF